MGFAGGDPQQLATASRGLGHLADDLATDATAIARHGRDAASAAGDGQVADAAETALAAIGGAVLATATVVRGLGDGATTAGTQLHQATGTGPR